MKGHIMWTELCEANNNHYIEHPEVHTAIAVVYGAAAVVFVGWFAKKICT